jgi:hypothetical protein
MKDAAEALYRAAKLTPPPRYRIIIVPSPFVLRFAGGFASWIWSKRSHAATHAATYEATYEATHEATYEATHEATEEATYAATLEATRAATLEATKAATYAATYAATHAATEAATLATIDEQKWYVMTGGAMSALAMRLGEPKALLMCAEKAYRLWSGGNQWSGWVAFISFFRYIVRLPIDYSNWEPYEVLAAAGPRVVHKDFCLIAERPSELHIDHMNRPHCDDGPFCRWRDGSALYAVHGVRVPAWVVEHPDRITVSKIESETNIEVRRVMIERYGHAKYLMDSGAREIHRDDFGVLYRKDVADDEPIVMVKVCNSTPESDGSYKDYFLRVNPELRPLGLDNTMGEPQPLTAHNAVAITFGLRGDEYAPEVET